MTNCYNHITHYSFEYCEPDAKLGNADVYYTKNGVFIVTENNNKNIFLKEEN